MTAEEIDASGDGRGLSMTSWYNLSGFLWVFSLLSSLFDDLGDVVVILDLRPDESLFEAGIAREVNYRIF